MVLEAHRPSSNSKLEQAQGPNFKTRSPKLKERLKPLKTPKRRMQPS